MTKKKKNVYIKKPMKKDMVFSGVKKKKFDFDKLTMKNIKLTQDQFSFLRNELSDTHDRLNNNTIETIKKNLWNSIYDRNHDIITFLEIFKSIENQIGSPTDSHFNKIHIHSVNTRGELISKKKQIWKNEK